MHIYSQFINLAGKGPKVYIRKPDKRTNKIYSSMQFKTLALPCLNYYYDLFYKEGKKIIRACLPYGSCPATLLKEAWIRRGGGRLI
jgi:hypothetical protein